MDDSWSSMKAALNRRAFLKNGLTAATIGAAGTGFLASGSPLLAEDGDGDHGGYITRGDAALLRFAAAAEILETDLWVQYTTS